MVLETKKTGRRGRPENEELAVQRREDILVVATQVFAEKTFRGTDVQEIADRVGVGKGTVYRYFASKEELFLAAVARGLGGLRAEVERVHKEVGEPLERFRQAIVTFLSYFDAHPDLVEILIQERGEFRRHGKLTFFSWTEEEVKERRALFESLHREGQIPQPIQDRLIDTIAEFLFGTVISARFSGRGISLVDRADDVLGLLLDGLRGTSGEQQDGAHRGTADR